MNIAAVEQALKKSIARHLKAVPVITITRETVAASPYIKITTEWNGVASTCWRNATREFPAKDLSLSIAAELLRLKGPKHGRASVAA